MVSHYDISFHFRPSIIARFIKVGNYREVAQRLVYLSIVTLKLTKDSKIVYDLIEKLAVNEHRINLYTEIPIAFKQAITDVENAIDIEEESDMSEISDIVDANNHLLKLYMLRPPTDSSQSSDSSEDDSDVALSQCIDELYSEE